MIMSPKLVASFLLAHSLYCALGLHTWMKQAAVWARAVEHRTEALTVIACKNVNPVSSHLSDSSPIRPSDETAELGLTP